VRPRSAGRLDLVMKRSIFAFAVLGLVGCFLPLTAGLSWFDIRHLDAGWTVWLVLAAFALPTLVSASRSETDRTAAIVGLVSFGYLTYKFRTGVLDLVLHGSLGGIMMGIAVVGGLACSLLAFAGTRQR
jgi:hypothetical protein